MFAPWRPTPGKIPDIGSQGQSCPPFLPFSLFHLNYEKETGSKLLEHLCSVLCDFPLIDHLEEPVGATFKAVIIAVYMPKTLQTKCKTCFGGPRMILYGF